MAEQPLDDIDQKIVQTLLDDARTPIADLSRQVNLSRNAVRHRIEKLEKANVIAGYHAKLGTGSPNQAPMIAMMMVYRKDRMRGQDVTKYIADIPEVKSCYIMSGEYDLILKVESVSHDRIHQIWENISSLSGVDNIHTTFTLSTIKP
ncbi:AsnC family transcriptional regulator [Marinomonas mediterranea]|jgi:Transcriptional regulators|uniref:Transcriptional regulator, AsnC family n=1 Tax=Marinomonas mediterranea (strain ATCC 700492 / JCM 21426 / NBRC 103028 / MMB-1) TaxID=717774 RepID=F2JZ91_MARM1|nr:Lrp/AsnC family transcriptional regulator [Marinomonas mediterranea]ADZ93176.1 transcriptional regulator, AsnC family [Marinomonas mediterranea MMB-1]WCN15136.1 AsnC family transcriptional regulator [Marinomonas mediterranea]WCN19179.1 AsnC family transcriptional regulator [Marinomonas mediterranea MMB-1]